jgi:hypothetical protein
MPAYDLHYERRGGRCAWCWEALGDIQSHTVARSVGPPDLELRFHHRCWVSYRSLSGIEGRELKALYREWTPPRLEALRLHAGLTLDQLASKLRLSKLRLVAYLSGQVPRLGAKPTARLRGLAVDTRFERTEEAGAIDWSDRRAVFCLCLHCRWTAGALASRLGVRDNTVTAWWEKGCPRASVRHYARLTILARQHDFDASMLLDDYLWTPQLAREALAAAGLTRSAFANVAGCHEALIRDATAGQRRLNRHMAYYLTRAAIRLELSLPPKGRIEPKRRPPRPFPGDHRGPQGDRIWKPEELARLGTMPDKDLAALLGTRSYVSVMRMRRILGIPKISRRMWDGTIRPAPVPLAEVLERYHSRFRMPP